MSASLCAVVFPPFFRVGACPEAGWRRWGGGTEGMRPKTFPAAPYVGNTRQRLQEIKEGLKQPAKLVSQALHGGSSRSEGSRVADSKGGKDATNRQQQLRPPQKFNNYQNALREIRRSLMPFANESGEAGEVNRQMLQELVNAGCDQVSLMNSGL